MNQLKALILDVDGTISDNERIGHRVSFNLAFAEAGLDWVWDEAIYGELLSVSGGKERIKAYLEMLDPEKSDQGVAGTAGVEHLHARKSWHYQNLLATGQIKLRPGVERLLKQAGQMGVRVGLATTSALENVNPLLEKNLDKQLMDSIEFIGAGDMVALKKPAPDIYELVMSRMELEAKDCLAIEDSANGLESALAAGLKSVLITANEYTRTDDFSGASLVVDQLGMPESPCRQLDGNLLDQEYVDIELLEQIHAESWR
jgi:HAD superfamily hydrolase (TIGR01509 family)